MNRLNAVEAEVARVEGLFANPDTFCECASKVNELTTELEAAKENVTKLYARWEQLEAIRAASN
jgi:ATP-binding cassette subfamily F protein uup